jgi:hypothetical protein
MGVVGRVWAREVVDPVVLRPGGMGAVTAPRWADRGAVPVPGGGHEYDGKQVVGIERGGDREGR